MPSSLSINGGWPPPPMVGRLHGCLLVVVSHAVLCGSFLCGRDAAKQGRKESLTGWRAEGWAGA